MIYVISGSRAITDVKAVEAVLRGYIASKDLVHVGDARGVDAIAADFAHRYFNDVVVHKPDWDKYGKSAGPIRNQEMIDQSDVLIAIWDGKSRGTKGTIDMALKRGIETHVHRIGIRS